MKRLSFFGFVPQTTSDQSRKRERYSSSSVSNKEVPGDEMTVQRATSPEPGPSHPIVPATTSDSHTDEQYCRSRVLSQLNFVRHDVGTYTRQDVLRMSDNDKLWLLQNAFRPGASYKFQQREEYREKQSFQSAWLHQFPWLCFSESCNGGFCVFCFVFAKHQLSLGQLVTSAMTNFTRAKLTLQEHSKQNAHLMASMDVVDFKDRMKRGGLSVQQLLRDQASALVQSNRLKLLSILKTVAFCGRQNIPLRGHREQGDSHLSNPGNFCTLFDFRIDAGVQCWQIILKQHH